MQKTGTYHSAKAFRQALDSRLKQIASKEGKDIQRLRRHLAFDRLLARIFHESDTQWTLKGGYAIELWLDDARATRDIDLTLKHLPSTEEKPDLVSIILRAELQRLSSQDLRDWFEFRIGSSTLDIEAAPYGGARFPVEARMDGRIFARFHLDVGIGDVALEPIETMTCRDWLGFAGLIPARLRLLSKEQQFAEKLHAYTLPDRQTPNSRVKDLVDMALLISRLSLNSDNLLVAIQETFNRRNSHPVPSDLNKPPDNWRTPFNALSTETRLNLDIDEAFNLVQTLHLELILGERQKPQPHLK